MKEHLSYTLGDAFGIEEGPKLNFRLQTNPSLNQLVNLLKSTRPDWERLWHVISASTQAVHGNGEFVGHLGEQHIQMVMEDTKKSSTQSQDIVLNPIKAGTETKNFSFRLGANGNLIAKDRKTNKDITDYDSLILVGGLPVVGAIRLSGTRKKGDQYLGIFKNNYINKVLQPLSEHFRTNTFGFLAIVPPEMIKGGTSELRFVRNGGILVPMTAKLDEFRGHAQLLQNQGDSLKQQDDLEKKLNGLRSNQDVYPSQQDKGNRRERLVRAQKKAHKYR